jgi:hypothetical protein
MFKTSELNLVDGRQYYFKNCLLWYKNTMSALNLTDAWFCKKIWSIEIIWFFLFTCRVGTTENTLCMFCGWDWQISHFLRFHNTSTPTVKKSSFRKSVPTRWQKITNMLRQKRNQQKLVFCYKHSLKYNIVLLATLICIATSDIYSWFFQICSKNKMW